MQDHLTELFAWGRGWPLPHIVELGVRTGNSTSAFLAALEIHRRGHLWSFDIAEPDVPGNWRDDECRESDYWTFAQCDGMSAEALAAAPQEIDVLFLDTDPHTLVQTLAELLAWGPRVRRGGVILVHDTDDPAAAEPALALKEYQRMYHKPERELDLMFRRGCHGLGIMRVR